MTIILYVFINFTDPNKMLEYTFNNHFGELNNDFKVQFKRQPFNKMKRI